MMDKYDEGKLYLVIMVPELGNVMDKYEISSK